MTKVFGHRGASGYAPENTLEAFALAVEMGADGVELDVQLTKDGQIVVTHDEEVSRVSGVKGWVKDFTLEEIKKLNVSKPIDGYKPTQIPTLEEVYTLLKDTNLEINVELKTSCIWYEDLEQKTYELSERMGMLNRVIFSSFNHYSIQKLKAIDPDVRTGMLYSDVLCDIDNYCRNLVKTEALHPWIGHIKMPSVWEEYKKTSLPLRFWTVNEEADMKFCLEQKVDTMITNYPDKALKLRK